MPKYPSASCFNALAVSTHVKLSVCSRSNESMSVDALPMSSIIPQKARYGRGAAPVAKCHM